MTWFKIDWFEFFFIWSQILFILGRIALDAICCFRYWKRFSSFTLNFAFTATHFRIVVDGFHSLFLNLPYWLEKIIFLEVLSFEPPDISRSLLVWLWNFRNGISFEPAWIVRFFDSSHLFEIRLQMWLYSFVPRITQHQLTLEIWMVRDDEWNLTQKSIM